MASRASSGSLGTSSSSSWALGLGEAALDLLQLELRHLGQLAGLVGGHLAEPGGLVAERPPALGRLHGRLQRRQLAPRAGPSRAGSLATSGRAISASTSRWRAWRASRASLVDHRAGRGGPGSYRRAPPAPGPDCVRTQTPRSRVTDWRTGSRNRPPEPPLGRRRRPVSPRCSISRAEPDGRLRRERHADLRGS